MPPMTQIDRNRMSLSDRLLEDETLLKYLSALERVNDQCMQMFEDIESICNSALREKFEWMDEHEDASSKKDTKTLWKLFSIVSDDSYGVRPVERKIRVPTIFKQENRIQMNLLELFILNQATM